MVTRSMMVLPRVVVGNLSRIFNLSSTRRPNNILFKILSVSIYLISKVTLPDPLRLVTKFSFSKHPVLLFVPLPPLIFIFINARRGVKTFNILLADTVHFQFARFILNISNPELYEQKNFDVRSMIKKKQKTLDPYFDARKTNKKLCTPC